MSDNVIESYIAGVQAPELLAVIGIVAIIAYVAVKSIPMMKELRTANQQNDYDLKLKELDLEQRREDRMAEEASRHDENERERIRSIGVQNQLLAGLQSTIETVAGQQALNNASLSESKDRSRELGRTVSDTNMKVTELHNVLLRKSTDNTD
jgi:type II secretory pathway pseudopilin PulG|nr:MAG TPA: hypothetical protein [Caudoviricetes sp.]